MAIAIVLAATCVPADRAFADQGPLFSGHGPVFGMATPTNGQGAWSFDFGLMGRVGNGDDGAMSRVMLGYGVTPDLQVTFSAPLVFSSAPLPPGRMTGMMPGSGDFEGLVAWRFHRQGVDVGTRFESTAYGSVIVPGPQRAAGAAGQLARAPGTFLGAATGLASRSHYLWGGAGYTRFAERDGDRRPDIVSYSAVWGYRPPALRSEYPHWDWRVMAELTGERSRPMRHNGLPMPGTGGHQVLLGPTALGCTRTTASPAGYSSPSTATSPRRRPGSDSGIASISATFSETRNRETSDDETTVVRAASTHDARCL